MSTHQTPADATPEPAPLPVLAGPPPEAELQSFARLGRWLSLAELDENTAESKGAAAALRFALAAMLGVNPTAALTELSFIHGRLNLSAQLVRALASKAGYDVQRVSLDDTQCTARLVVSATGQVKGETTYTIEDARVAGLIRDRSNWKTTPQRMLWARASKRVVDDFAPEVSLGIVTPEDEAEIQAVPWDDAAMADEGEVLEGVAVETDGSDVPTAPSDADAGGGLEPPTPASAPERDPDTAEQLDADADLEHGDYGDGGLI